MITTNTPGAYKKCKPKNKGYYLRIHQTEVETMLQQGLSYAEIATRLDVTIEAIRMQQRKWRREQEKPQEGAEVRE